MKLHLRTPKLDVIPNLIPDFFKDLISPNASNGTHTNKEKKATASESYQVVCAYNCSFGLTHSLSLPPALLLLKTFVVKAT